MCRSTSIGVASTCACIFALVTLRVPEQIEDGQPTNLLELQKFLVGLKANPNVWSDVHPVIEC